MVSPAPAPCVLCGRPAAWRRRLARVPDYLTRECFDIHQCEDCGLRVTHPFPADADLGRYYPPRYRGNRHSRTGALRVKRRRQALARCFPPGFRGRVLDLGAGDGSFALAMRAAGWEVSATEINPEAVNRLRQQGVDAKLAPDAKAEGFALPFDAITAWHVLEHVSRPHELARWAHGLLQPGGIFQPTVPNAASLQARLFGRQWLHLDVPRHLFHFTPPTFRALLEQSGFEPVGLAVFAIEYDWFGVIQSALNPLCRHANVLFERLTNPPQRAAAPWRDLLVSYALAAPLAALSLPPLLLAWACGDGATLTMTCKPKAHTPP